MRYVKITHFSDPAEVAERGSRIRVCCDEPGCGWTNTVPSLEDIEQYHNQPCPKCGKGILISDHDMAVMQSTRESIEAMKKFFEALGIRMEVGSLEGIENADSAMQIRISTRPQDTEEK